MFYIIGLIITGMSLGHIYGAVYGFLTIGVGLMLGTIVEALFQP